VPPVLVGERESRRLDERLEHDELVEVVDGPDKGGFGVLFEEGACLKSIL
jgi:hypothetical protein